MKGDSGKVAVDLERHLSKGRPELLARWLEKNGGDEEMASKVEDAMNRFHEKKLVFRGSV